MNGKTFYKHRLLRLTKVKKFHVIGCSRSGTTMMFYAMSAFENAHLFEKETRPWMQPEFKRTVEFLLNPAHFYRPINYFTKRHSQWWTKENVQAMYRHALENGATLLHIVRDPRDVLTSSHPLDFKEYYISPEHWRRSIEAGEELSETLEDLGSMITIRYEDLIQNPRAVEALLALKFDFRLKWDARGLEHLQENVAISGVSGTMISNMHRLRNFDPSTIGRWRTDPRKTSYLDRVFSNDSISRDLHWFMKKFGYRDDDGGINSLNSRTPKPLETAHSGFSFN